MKTNECLYKVSDGKNTKLDLEFSKYVKNVLLTTTNEDIINRWETYQLIIQELIIKNKNHYVSEIKYRITDGEKPNDVFVDVLNKDSDDLPDLVWFLKRRVEEYMEDDNFLIF